MMLPIDCPWKNPSLGYCSYMNKTYERSESNKAFVKEAVEASQKAYARMEEYTSDQHEELAKRAQSTRKHGARSQVRIG